MSDLLPFVRVVVVNFDGGPMTVDCLSCLLATDWPADRIEVVLVDNGSRDGIAARVRAELPAVRVLERRSNSGFAGGGNAGITAPGAYDHVALVNNDVRVEPGWLRPLVAALDIAGRVGAACPKILFDDRFLEVVVDVPDAAPGADGRTLGVRLVGARLDGACDDDRIAFDEGWFDAEHRDDPLARWSWRRATVRVRVTDGHLPETLELGLCAPQPRRAVLRSAKEDVVVDVGPEPTWVGVALGDDVVDVVNNAGSALYRRGFGGDRGFLERDRGQYDEPADVFAWCGALVLLSRQYLADVGLFDEPLFLYYEDIDLSWRGRLRGWRYVYEPAAVVRHRHAATSGVGSVTFRYFNERNRLLVLAKHAPAGLAWRAALGHVRRTIRATACELLGSPARRPPVPTDAAHRRRVLAGFLRRLPAALRDRWRADRCVTRRSLLAWTAAKETAH